MSARRLRLASIVAAPPPGLVGLVVFVLVVAALPLAALRAVAAAPDHLLISEVVTGGASASDELIELYNPTAAPLPLEGLELVYVSASGATVSRRAAWAAGASSVAAYGHALVANEAGVYASIADVIYTTGMAAAGGSVALRIQGATTALDAVGWGTATGTWLEGSPAPAPPAGSSIERLPGGAAGSTQDTEDNATDFAVRAVPDPQNSASAATPHPSASATPPSTPTASAEPTPSVDATPTPTPDATPLATPTTTATATATPSPSSTATSAATASPTASADPVIDVATARSLADGTHVTIDVVALTDAAFNDGGGYVADATAGIAVLVSDGSFARGERLRITGTLDDRYAQRTLRVGGADVAVVGSGEPPAPRAVVTGQIGESTEGSLVRVAATIVGGPTALSTGPAYDVDDGSGAARLLVATSTGIDTTAWQVGTALELIGVVGQRDSSGTGTGGYRLQPRDPTDVVAVTAPSGASPTPSPSTAATPTPTASATPPPPGADVVSIAEARAAVKNARVTVRGVVTLPTGVVDEATAVVQDATGGIVLRLGDEAGQLTRGRLVEVSGARSTKSGMETIRVTTPPTDLGGASEPEAALVRTADVGETLEARLAVVRGVVAAPRHAASGTVSFDVDDGSGPVRVVILAGIGFDGELEAGDWVEVVGVVGQETTGTLPLRGYRLWPRDPSDVRVTAFVTGADSGDGASAPTGSGGGARGGTAERTAGLGALDEPGGVGGDLEIGATLVARDWPDLGLAGLLWDGERLAAIDEDVAAAIARSVPRVTVPLALRLTGLVSVGRHEATGIGILTLRSGQVMTGGPLTAPATQLPTEGQAPRWVTLVGRLAGMASGERATLVVAGRPPVAVVRACAEGSLRAAVGAQVSVTGIGTAAPATLTVGCDGIRAAPALGSPPASAAPHVARDAVGATPATDRAGATVDPRRPMAALVLLVALVLVVAATAARAMRAAGVEGPGDAPPAGDVDEEADDEVAADIGSGVRAPTLTLVPVPHERGP